MPETLTLKRPDQQNQTDTEPNDLATHQRPDGTPLVHRPGVEYGDEYTSSRRTLVVRGIGRMAAGLRAAFRSSTQPEVHAPESTIDRPAADAGYKLNGDDADEAFAYFQKIRATKDERQKKGLPVENGHESRRIDRRIQRKKFLGRIAAGIANTFRPEDNTPIVEAPDSRAHYRIEENSDFFDEYKELATIRQEANDEARAAAARAQTAKRKAQEAKNKARIAKREAKIANNKRRI